MKSFLPLTLATAVAGAAVTRAAAEEVNVVSDGHWIYSGYDATAQANGTNGLDLLDKINFAFDLSQASPKYIYVSTAEVGSNCGNLSVALQPQENGQIRASLYIRKDNLPPRVVDELPKNCQIVTLPDRMLQQIPQVECSITFDPAGAKSVSIQVAKDQTTDRTWKATVLQSGGNSIEIAKLRIWDLDQPSNDCDHLFPFGAESVLFPGPVGSG